MSESYLPQSTHARFHSINPLQEYQELYNLSIAHPEQFWSQQAKERLQWLQPFTQVKWTDWETGVNAWFLNGKLNVCDNCVDRHLKDRADKIALIWEADESQDSQRITYRELHAQVCRMANVLKNKGVLKGDKVAIYMPMVPAAVYAMLACARIGAVHNVVFAGFSAEALRDRINDAACKIVITTDEGVRGGKRFPLKRTVDEAVMACPCVEHVLVSKRTGAKVPFYPQRDCWLDEEMANQKPYAPLEAMDSEDLLFLLYTSGSTGKPKGVAHTTGGYLLHASLTHEYVFNYDQGDVYACVADIGWITGHTYVIYGPLANGASTVLFESTPLYPNPGRYWEMIEKWKINQFYTAPTAIRAVARAGDEWPQKYDLSSLKVLGSVGEPINPEAWRWYYEKVGQSKVDIVDTWWQTETGGIMITPLPGVTPLKPGSASLPFFGVDPVLLDEYGKELEGNDVKGILALRSPWPSMARTVQNDHPRYIQTYLRPFNGYYMTGDGCYRDADGFYWITGRVDDVLNVSGHRIGTAEVESALVTHPACAEAAVVGVPHDIKGQGIFAFILLKPGYEQNEDLIGELKNEVRHHIGPIATPDRILIAPGLPKTRSGKIMRRILRKIASGDVENLGDTSTLAEPEVVDQLIKLTLN